MYNEFDEIEQERAETPIEQPQESELMLAVLPQPEEEDPTYNPWREAAQREKKRVRRWRRVGIVCLVALLGAAAFLFWGGSLFGKNPQITPDDGDSASSIIDIFQDEKPTIPRCKGDSDVRLVCAREYGDELTAREVYAKVNPAVVMVASCKKEYASIGTGILLTSDGYVLTNAHVIAGGESCFVTLNSGISYDVELVGYDTQEDLAVLKAVDAEGLPTAEFGNSDLAVVGDPVYAIGNPLGVELRGTLTEGIISAVDRSVEVGERTMSVIQTTAALNNGNSGGPLINSSGQVIGINTLKMGNSDMEASVEGLGFALPIAEASFVINDIIATGEYHGTPTLGVLVYNVTVDGEDHVIVYDVTEGSGAARAGIQPADLILAVDGSPISCINDLLAIRRDHKVNDTVTLTILRGSETLDVSVKLLSDR